MTEYYQGPNNRAELLAVTITLPTIAVFLTVWRIWYRVPRKLLGMTDLFLVAGLVIALCQAGFHLSAYTSWGYGYHKDDIPPEVLSSLIPKKLFWVNQIFFKTAAGSIKLSICAVYLAVFRRPVLTGARIAQIANYVLIGVVGGYYFGGTLVSTFQCDPIHKAWMPDVEGKCIKNDQFRLANGYINCITSLWIIILPFPVLLGMERKNKELLQFLGLVGLGLIHTSCAIWRVAMMYIPKSPEAKADPYYNNTRPNTIAMVEIFIAIIAAAIIVMRPCFHSVGKTVVDTLTNRTNDANAYGSSKTSHIITVGGSRKEVKDREGFSRIAVTTEIEMESRTQSTEDLMVAPGAVPPAYNPAGPRVKH
ncbi:hypothetical protein ACRE_062790 [Hapsidospora chrysogenum ATCC 11550]|uniref:Rhodopsin domain-containing protein n=1 Tax=Hapsidospora chrysogenum (strain ATCC 11550 / CBS 779.69 / DSM 880 / IAM 14645 / JCM 23072 / IMI 49137) TaxID=857340 RepID=A0A086T0W8_HAPC1|nr:hypothetical protein ACRE_062790 [Hapsidospora chrysogenum ATCC 11550]